MAASTSPMAPETAVSGVFTAQESTPSFEFATWEQFEVYQQDGERWRLIGAFPDLDIAKAMARTRSTRMRLVRSLYNECSQIEQDVIADLAASSDIT